MTEIKLPLELEQEFRLPNPVTLGDISAVSEKMLDKLLVEATGIGDNELSFVKNKFNIRSVGDDLIYSYDGKDILQVGNIDFDSREEEDFLIFRISCPYKLLNKNGD